MSSTGIKINVYKYFSVTLCYLKTYFIIERQSNDVKQKKVIVYILIMKDKCFACPWWNPPPTPSGLQQRNIHFAILSLNSILILGKSRVSIKGNDKLTKSWSLTRNGSELRSWKILKHVCGRSPAPPPGRIGLRGCRELRF